jgi:hypothetical protein
MLRLLGTYFLITMPGLEFVGNEVIGMIMIALLSKLLQLLGEAFFAPRYL